ncbi:hypothetical protein RT717_12935 [Imperialibacter roseus]|uniref:Uncharacterized protein n=1 Tax=Imperialibacter roseus TaxID=1324217 RepID=A0ABZ0IX23_9BACT|nr:hypothetical protein [Imperialibacter roseus]WOK09544.1 hypothetical protein RT717_12935 [Imperialibacter roseus]
MRTSLTEIAQIESYLQGKLGIAATLLFEVRMLLEPSLSASVKLQKIISETVLLHGRNQLRKELTAIDHKLFTAADKRAFRTEIDQIFNQDK